MININNSKEQKETCLSSLKWFQLHIIIFALKIFQCMHGHSLKETTLTRGTSCFACPKRLKRMNKALHCDQCDSNFTFCLDCSELQKVTKIFIYPKICTFFFVPKVKYLSDFFNKFLFYLPIIDWHKIGISICNRKFSILFFAQSLEWDKLYYVFFFFFGQKRKSINFLSLLLFVLGLYHDSMVYNNCLYWESEWIFRWSRTRKEKTSANCTSFFF